MAFNQNMNNDFDDTDKHLNDDDQISYIDYSNETLYSYNPNGNSKTSSIQSHFFHRPFQENQNLKNNIVSNLYENSKKKTQNTKSSEELSPKKNKLDLLQEDTFNEILCNLKCTNRILRQNGLNIRDMTTNASKMEIINNFQNNIRHIVNDSTQNIKPGICLCEDSYPVSIKSVSTIGECSFYIKWEVHNTDGIHGYEIYVDGCLRCRLHSSFHEAAIIYCINIKRRHIITLQAIAQELEPDEEYTENEANFKWSVSPVTLYRGIKTLTEKSLISNNKDNNNNNNNDNNNNQWTPSIYVYIPEDNFE